MTNSSKDKKSNLNANKLVDIKIPYDCCWIPLSTTMCSTDPTFVVQKKPMMIVVGLECWELQGALWMNQA